MDATETPRRPDDVPMAGLEGQSDREMLTLLRERMLVQAVQADAEAEKSQRRVDAGDLAPELSQQQAARAVERSAEAARKRRLAGALAAALEATPSAASAISSGWRPFSLDDRDEKAIAHELWLGMADGSEPPLLAHCNEDLRWVYGDEIVVSTPYDICHDVEPPPYGSAPAAKRAKGR